MVGASVVVVVVVVAPPTEPGNQVRLPTGEPEIISFQIPCVSPFLAPNLLSRTLGIGSVTTYLPT